MANTLNTAKNVNVILEGCDCVGKSSISEVLQQYGFKGIHYGPPKNAEDGEKLNREGVKVLNSKVGYVVDRFALGECVYAPIFRKYYPDYMRDLELDVLPHNYLVLVDSDVKTVEKRFDGKFITKQHIPQILRDYRQEFTLSRWPRKILVNSSDMKPSEIAADILKAVETMQKDPYTIMTRELCSI